MALQATVFGKLEHKSETKDYLGSKGEVLATFEVRGVNYKPYQIAMERIRNIVESRKNAITEISQNEKSEDDLLTESMSAHLIVGWSGVELSFDKGKTFNAVEYSIENATTLLNLPTVGMEIYKFIMRSANEIFLDELKSKTELMGKSDNSTSGVKEPKKATKSKA